MLALALLVVGGVGYVIAVAALLEVHCRALRALNQSVALLELRVNNLHRDHRHAHVRRLQVATARPPPLSQAATVEVHLEELIETERRSLLPTVPEGENGNETD